MSFQPNPAVIAILIELLVVASQGSGADVVEHLNHLARVHGIDPDEVCDDS